MRQVGLLCIVILLFVVTWTVIVPMEQRDDSARDLNERAATSQKAYIHEQSGAAPQKVTFQEVSEKSRDALTTTAAYMKQEKEKLQSKMSITLQRVDQELARLRAEVDRVKTDDKSELNRRILDLQEAKASLLNLKEDLREPTQAAWKTLKANWNRLEMDINVRMKQDEKERQAVR